MLFPNHHATLQLHLNDDDDDVDGGGGNYFFPEKEHNFILRRLCRAAIQPSCYERR